MTEMHIYGIHPVEEALARAPEHIDEILVAGDPGQPRFEAIVDPADAHDIPVRRTNLDKLESVADGGNHQRVAARVRSYPYYTLEDALEIGEQSDGHACILALAQVQDPGNLGAILRSGAALDVDAVVIPKHRSAQMTPAVVRASAGMAFHVPLVRVTNLSRALRTLKDEWYWIVGTVAEDADSQPLWTMDWELDACIVMGGEHEGMRPGVEKECDFRVTIPMDDDVESLNVSVAAALALYDRRRTLEQPD